MNLAGLVLLAVAGLWIAYLVPHRLRYRQHLLDSRTDDRFSEGLRVLRVAHAAGAGTSAVREAHAARVAIHPGPRRGEGGGHMDRPHAARDRVAADAAGRSAAEHARRAAYLARRAAAARRRAVLSAVLLLLTVVGWSVVGAAAAPLVLGAVPTAALAGVLVLGRRAVLAGARADAAWEAGAPSRVPLPGTGRPAGHSAEARAGAVGRAVHPSEAVTEIIARVPRRSVTERAAGDAADTRGATAAPTLEQAARPAAEATRDAAPAARRAGTAHVTPDATLDATPAHDLVDVTASVPQETTWSPVPVPPPAYTLKPSAPRREPAPLPEASALASSTAAPASAADGVAAGRAAEVAAATGQHEAEPEGATPATATAPGLDLDAILARRRAAGE